MTVKTRMQALEPIAALAGAAIETHLFETTRANLLSLLPRAGKENGSNGKGDGSNLAQTLDVAIQVHQQPEVNYLPRFSPQLISPARYTLSVYRAGEIDLFENLDIVHIRLLVAGDNTPALLGSGHGEIPPTFRRGSGEIGRGERGSRRLPRLL